MKSSDVIKAPALQQGCEKKRAGAHIPMRMCAICRKRAPKSELTRFVIVPGIERPLPDINKKSSGRGIYLCDDTRCRETFSRRKVKKKVKGQEV